MEQRRSFEERKITKVEKNRKALEEKGTEKSHEKKEKRKGHREENIREQNDTMIGRAVYREPLPYSHERLFLVAARPIVCIRSKFYYS